MTLNDCWYGKKGTLVFDEDGKPYERVWCGKCGKFNLYNEGSKINAYLEELAWKNYNKQKRKKKRIKNA